MHSTSCWWISTVLVASTNSSFRSRRPFPSSSCLHGERKDGLSDKDHPWNTVQNTIPLTTPHCQQTTSNYPVCMRRMEPLGTSESRPSWRWNNASDVWMGQSEASSIHCITTSCKSLHLCNSQPLFFLKNSQVQSYPCCIPFAKFLLILMDAQFRFARSFRSMPYFAGSTAI